jgi:hypothetical protein
MMVEEETQTGSRTEPPSQIAVQRLRQHPRAMNVSAVVAIEFLGFPAPLPGYARGKQCAQPESAHAAVTQGRQASRSMGWDRPRGHVRRLDAPVIPGIGGNPADRRFATESSGHGATAAERSTFPNVCPEQTKSMAYLRRAREPARTAEDGSNSRSRPNSLFLSSTGRAALEAWEAPTDLTQRKGRRANNSAASVFLGPSSKR